MALINLKKVNIEFILSLIFFLLLFYTTIQYTYPVLKNLNFFNNLVQFEINSTWGRQLEITQGVVILFVFLFVIFISLLRIRQIIKDR